jgi:hypothetical protein
MGVISKRVAKKLYPAKKIEKANGIKESRSNFKMWIVPLLAIAS